ncbi:MAG: hypothetical protein D6681_10120 [Calditrichaeota bacterium]|nr:MAG: hypothetical protein D6681_10120 [Calditrichota bacterium]
MGRIRRVLSQFYFRNVFKRYYLFLLWLRWKELPFNYTEIEVVVVFRMEGEKPNNFIVTAYPKTSK